jgi:hypothetical protein
VADKNMCVGRLYTWTLGQDRRVPTVGGCLAGMIFTGCSIDPTINPSGSCSETDSFRRHSHSHGKHTLRSIGIVEASESVRFLTLLHFVDHSPERRDCIIELGRKAIAWSRHGHPETLTAAIIIPE